MFVNSIFKLKIKMYIEMFGRYGVDVKSRIEYYNV